MARRIVLATSNPAKRQQLRWLLAGLPVEPVEAAAREVPETAPDLAGNASAKALAYAAHGLAIASDGGLEVPALSGRWSPLLTGRLGQAKLHELAQGLADRRVSWSEAVALADHGRLLAVWTESGTKGILAADPWPAPSDFWVWDIFLFPAVGKVWSALDAGERNALDPTWTRLRARVRELLASPGA